MVNRFAKFVLASTLVIMAAPAYASTAVQIFACQEGDDADEDRIEAAASAWLKAARTMKGGENMQATIYYPTAANMLNDGDLLFMITTPSHAEWGAFWDGYKDSPAEDVDFANRDLVFCPDSNLFEAVKVE